MTKTTKQVLEQLNTWDLVSELYKRYELPILYAWVGATYTWILITKLG